MHHIRTISAVIMGFALATGNTARAFPEEKNWPVMPPEQTAELKDGETVRSLVTQIIKHGDLRDSAFIDRIFGWHVDNYSYLVSIPHTNPKSEFKIAYPAPPPINPSIKGNMAWYKKFNHYAVARACPQLSIMIEATA